MDAVRDDKTHWPGYIEEAVKRIRQKDNDQNIYTYFFEYIGIDGHPKVPHHRQMAKELTALIREIKGW